MTYYWCDKQRGRIAEPVCDRTQQDKEQRCPKTCKNRKEIKINENSIS